MCVIMKAAGMINIGILEIRKIMLKNNITYSAAFLLFFYMIVEL